MSRRCTFVLTVNYLEDGRCPYDAGAGKPLCYHHEKQVAGFYELAALRTLTDEGDPAVLRYLNEDGGGRP